MFSFSIAYVTSFLSWNLFKSMYKLIDQTKDESRVEEWSLDEEGQIIVAQSGSVSHETRVTVWDTLWRVEPQLRGGDRWFTFCRRAYRRLWKFITRAYRVIGSCSIPPIENLNRGYVIDEKKSMTLITVYDW